MQYFCWAPQIKVESQHFNHMMYWFDLRFTVVLKEAKLQKQKRSLSSSRTRNFPLQFTLHSPHFFYHSGTAKIIIINKKNNPSWILSKYWSAWQHQETVFLLLFILSSKNIFILFSSTPYFSMVSCTPSTVDLFPTNGICPTVWKPPASPPFRMSGLSSQLSMCAISHHDTQYMVLFLI